MDLLFTANNKLYFYIFVSNLIDFVLRPGLVSQRFKTMISLIAVGNIMAQFRDRSKQFQHATMQSQCKLVECETYRPIHNTKIILKSKETYQISNYQLIYRVAHCRPPHRMSCSYWVVCISATTGRFPPRFRKVVSVRSLPHRVGLLSNKRENWIITFQLLSKILHLINAIITFETA